MAKKWMQPGEGIVLEAKVFVWIKSPFNYNGTPARIYLTNVRFYATDRLFGTRLVDFPFQNIESVSSNKKHLVVEGHMKGKRYKLEIRRKGLEDSWEWMIKQRMEAK
jgi:hypothetical protein